MDYPKGGVKSIVDTLVGSIDASPGSTVQCATEVKRFVRDSSGRVIGVEAKNGKFLRAKLGVVSNAGTWATQELLLNSDGDNDAPKTRKSGREAQWRAAQSATPACNSFMHLHVGFSTAGLSAEQVAALQCHYMILSDWDKGVEAEDNAVLVSIPSTHDDSLAPEGHMVRNITKQVAPAMLFLYCDTVALIRSAACAHISGSSCLHAGHGKLRQMGRLETELARVCEVKRRKVSLLFTHLGAFFENVFGRYWQRRVLNVLQYYSNSDRRTCGKASSESFLTFAGAL